MARGPALVVAGDTAFRVVVEERSVHVRDVAPYRPGRFYERELPAVRGVLIGAAPLDLIVVDGYVDLDPSGVRASAPMSSRSSPSP